MRQLRFESRKLALNKRRFDLRYPNSRYREVCREERIRCLDLVDEFQLQGKEHLYRPLGDMHFNERGDQIAAHVIGRHVLEILDRPAH